MSVIYSLKRTLRNKEATLAGYVGHGMKNSMGDMTTPPTEGQNHHIRHGPGAIDVKYQTHPAISQLVLRIQHKICRRRQRAHLELACNCFLSNAWTRNCLITNGQALLDRIRAKRLHVKSARLSVDEFVMWNFDIGDWLDLPNPLYRVTPHVCAYARSG